MSPGVGVALRGRGFTLVEVLVALTIAGALGLLVHGGVVAVTDLSRAAARKEGGTLRAAAARRQIATWLRSVRTRPDSTGRAFAIRDGRRRGVADDELVVPTLAGNPLERSPAVVHLSIVRDAGVSGDDRTGLVAGLEREVGRRRGRSDLVLAPHAEGLQARALYDVRGERRWFRGWSSLVRVPYAVEIRLSGDSLAAPLRRPLLVVLPGGR